MTRGLVGGVVALALLVAPRTTAEQIPASSQAAQANRERHAADLKAAVALAATDNPKRDPVRARAILEALSTEPFDFYVAAAEMTRATFLRGEGATNEAEALVAQALERLLEAQRPLRERPPADALEADARAIRAVLFQPRVSRPFAFVNSEMKIVESNGTVTNRHILQTLPAAARAIFVAPEERAVLHEIIRALRGSRPPHLTSLADTFIPPVGPSLHAGALWSPFFAIDFSFLQAWVISSGPWIGEVTFLDEARTRAAVEVAHDAHGSTLLMEKAGAAWRAVGSTKSWAF